MWHHWSTVFKCLYVNHKFISLYHYRLKDIWNHDSIKRPRQALEVSIHYYISSVDIQRRIKPKKDINKPHLKTYRNVWKLVPAWTPFFLHNQKSVVAHFWPNKRIHLHKVAAKPTKIVAKKMFYLVIWAVCNLTFELSKIK